MPRGTITSYQALVEQAASDVDAWRKLQSVHAMKAEGRNPQILWNRRDGFVVVDAPMRSARPAANVGA